MLNFINKSILILLLIFSFATNNVYAIKQDSSTSAEIKVDHVANPLERLQEKIVYFFKFSTQDKLAYQKEILEKRLAELQYVIESGQVNYIEELASRYSSHLGRLTVFAIKNNMTAEKDKLLSDYKRHQVVIENLQSKFEANNGFWLAIQHDINLLTILGDQLKNLH